jgi:hypothetical protein
MANEAIPTTMSDGRAAVIVPVKHRLDSGTVKWLIAALAVSGVGIATGIEQLLSYFKDHQEFLSPQVYAMITTGLAITGAVVKAAAMLATLARPDLHAGDSK